jgi:hypothetical protein
LVDYRANVSLRLKGKVKRWLGQDYARPNPEPYPRSGWFFAVGYELVAHRKMFGQDEIVELVKFANNGGNLIVFEVLKDLPHKDDMAGWQFVGDDVDAAEINFHFGEPVLIMGDQKGYNIARNVMTAKRANLPSDIEVAAAEIDY